MLLWIVDPVSEIIFSNGGKCKKLECGKYTHDCGGVKCGKLEKCGCYSVCTVHFKKKKKEKK